MVVALFRLIGGIDRATRRSQGASTLSLLQVVAGRGEMRPSEIAELQQVHPSLVTRQVKELEGVGYLDVVEDPGDRRACLVSLTAAGSEEAHRLQEVGFDRFATFVADWDPDEVRTLTALITKLEQSKAATGEPNLETATVGERRARRRPRRPPIL
jgi:DNA-binding MarR family transcriptional regulator